MTELDKNTLEWVKDQIHKIKPYRITGKLGEEWDVWINPKQLLKILDTAMKEVA